LFWEICNEFIGDKIPQKIDVFKWYEIIKADYSGWKCNFKYDIDYLLSDIQKEKNVENLSQNKFSSDIDNTFKFLNRIIDFVTNHLKKKDLGTCIN